MWPGGHCVTGNERRRDGAGVVAHVQRDRAQQQHLHGRMQPTHGLQQVPLCGAVSPHRLGIQGPGVAFFGARGKIGGRVMGASAEEASAWLCVCLHVCVCGVRGCICTVLAPPIVIAHHHQAYELDTRPSLPPAAQCNRSKLDHTPSTLWSRLVCAATGHRQRPAAVGDIPHRRRLLHHQHCHWQGRL